MDTVTMYSWRNHVGDQIKDSDTVNSPDHYTKGIEVYDFIQSWEMSFPRGNVVKYVTRAPYKGNTLEDLKKARWYLDKLIKAAEEK